MTQAARAMLEDDISDVLVEGRGIRGIVTDRDIAISTVALGKDPGRTKLAAICSQAVAAGGVISRILHMTAVRDGAGSWLSGVDGFDGRPTWSSGHIGAQAEARAGEVLTCLRP